MQPVAMAARSQLARQATALRAVRRRAAVQQQRVALRLPQRQPPLWVGTVASGAAADFPAALVARRQPIKYP
jgi:hypothetical protein